MDRVRGRARAAAVELPARGEAPTGPLDALRQRAGAGTSSRETVEGVDEDLLALAARGVHGILDDVQLGERKGLRELVGDAKRRGDVQAASHEHRRDVRDAVESTSDRVVGEEGVVPEVVRDDAREAERKRASS